MRWSSDDVWTESAGGARPRPVVSRRNKREDTFSCWRLAYSNEPCSWGLPCPSDGKVLGALLGRRHTLCPEGGVSMFAMCPQRQVRSVTDSPAFHVHIRRKRPVPVLFTGGKGLEPRVRPRGQNDTARAPEVLPTTSVTWLRVVPGAVKNRQPHAGPAWLSG